MSSLFKTLTFERLAGCVFAFVFLGILLYAALGGADLSQDRNFFIVRLISAIAAGAAATMFIGEIKLTFPVALWKAQAGGGFAVFLLVFSTNPPALVSDRDSTRVASMIANYGNNLFEEADRIAVEILAKDPSQVQALAVRGGVAFYKQEYVSASDLFK